MSEQTRIWRIGELAERAGITVRTLHHYHRLGLLSPSRRTSGGHRCYTSKDVAQLQPIIALRSCGLSLEEIGAVLSAGADGGLADLLRRQLEVVDERIRQAVALRIRLLGILGELDQTVEPSVTEILRLIEETITLNHPFSAEQFAQLREQRARQVHEIGPAITDSFARSFSRFEATQHLVTGHDVDVDGNTATIRANLVAIHIWNDRPVEASILDRSFTAGGVITAALRRFPDGWRISKIENRVIWRTGFFGDMLQTR